MTEARTPEERDLMAAEYVLGTLDEAAHEAVEREQAADAGLRAAIYAWQDRLLALSARAPAQQPSPSLWARIESRLGTAPKAAVAAEAVAAPPWWQRLGLWQAFSGLAVAASLGLLALLLVLQPVGDGPGARYLALLQAPEGGATGWVVELQAGGEMRLLPVSDEAAAAVPPGRALQFWTKPEGAAGPTSLGLVQAGRPLVLPASRLPAVGRQQLFEITLEPEGGSPYDRPSGPILYVGRTVAL